MLGLVVAAREVVLARGSLQAARGEVSLARQHLSRGEVDQARQRLETAATRIDDAQGRTDGLVWSAAGQVPVVGRSVVTVREVVDVADVAVALGRQATEQAGGLLDGGQGQGLRLSGGGIDLQRLRTARSVLGDLPVGQLRQARQQLAATPASWVPGPLQRAREDTLRLAGQTIGVAEDAGRLLDVLRPFLGADGPRQYLVVMQNPAELRGTGGIPGYVSVLRAEGGQLSLTELQRHAVLSRDPGDEQPTPVQVSDTFGDRYKTFGADSLFVNVNLDPDLPTVAPVMLDLYQRRTGERPDGVIAVDPVALEAMFRLIGPLDVPDEAPDSGGRLPDPIPPEKIAEVTLIRAYDVFGGASPQRRTYLEETATAAFRQLLSSEWDAAAMGQRMARLASTRHLQLYSTHAPEQKVFRRLRVGGGLEPARQPADLLGLTVNNAAGNKMDVHLGHRLEVDLQLQLPDEDTPVSEIEDVERQATVRATVRNPLPASGRDGYIIGSFDRPHQEGGVRSLNGLARSWLSLWAPEATGLTAARTGDGPVQVSTDVIHDQRAFDYILETPSKSTTWWEADISGPAPITVEDGRIVYRLTWWRQAKAIPDQLDVSLQVPEGWRIADASMSGGGRPQGMGVWDNGQAVRLESGARSLTVEGAATADVDLEVTIAPDRGVMGRLWQAITP